MPSYLISGKPVSQYALYSLIFNTLCSVASLNQPDFWSITQRHNALFLEHNSLMTKDCTFERESGFLLFFFFGGGGGGPLKFYDLSGPSSQILCDDTGLSFMAAMSVEFCN